MAESWMKRAIITREPDIQQMRKDIYAVSISDKLTTDVLKEVHKKYKVLLEPHGAAGWAGLQQYFASSPADAHRDQLAISLETAHPAKFPEEIRNLLGIDPILPASMEGLDKLEESFDRLENDYAQFKELPCRQVLIFTYIGSLNFINHL